MPEIATDPSASCNCLYPGPGFQESQQLGPDRVSLRGRDARGRFAKGSSGNPRGRPPGIRNPRRGLPDLAARRLSAQALSDLLDRKPGLLLPLAAQLMPPPHAASDPAARLGIGLSSLQTAADLREVLSIVLAAQALGAGRRRGCASRHPSLLRAVRAIAARGKSKGATSISTSRAHGVARL
jgi:hypothetical protein